MMLGKFSHTIALGLVALFAALSILLLFVPVPAVNSKSFDAVLMALVAQVAAVVGYYFGSARGNVEPPRRSSITPTVPPPKS